MFGIWMAPSLNNSKQIAVLKTKALDWGGKIRASNGSHYETWIALHTNLTVRLKYALPACTLSKNECNSIMSPALKAALPRTGIYATLSSKIRDGCKSSGRIGCLSLYDYQRASRTALLVEHL